MRTSDKLPSLPRARAAGLLCGPSGHSRDVSQALPLLGVEVSAARPAAGPVVLAASSRSSLQPWCSGHRSRWPPCGPPRCPPTLLSLMLCPGPRRLPTAPGQGVLGGLTEAPWGQGRVGVMGAGVGEVCSLCFCPVNSSSGNSCECVSVGWGAFVCWGKGDTILKPSVTGGPFLLSGLQKMASLWSRHMYGGGKP